MRLTGQCSQGFIVGGNRNENRFSNTKKMNLADELNDMLEAARKLGELK